MEGVVGIAVSGRLCQGRIKDREEGVFGFLLGGEGDDCGCAAGDGAAGAGFESVAAAASAAEEGGFLKVDVAVYSSWLGRLLVVEESNRM